MIEYGIRDDRLRDFRQDRAAIVADTLIKHELVGSLEECLEVRA